MKRNILLLLWVAMVAGNLQAQDSAPVVYVNNELAGELRHLFVRPGEQVRMTAAGSHDPENEVIEYHWEHLPGSGSYAGTVNLSGSRSETVTITIPVAAVNQIIRIRVTVSDEAPVKSHSQLYFLYVRPSVRILPLGDSITASLWNWQGGYYQSYRRYLWEDIVADGINHADFIGTQYGMWGNANPGGTWDKNHEGHPGATTLDLLTGSGIGGSMSQWVEQYTSDVVLLMIGANDAGNPASVMLGSVMENMRIIIDWLRYDNPNVVIILARPTPNSNANRDRSIRIFGEYFPTLAEEKWRNRAPIFVVNMYNNGITPHPPDMLDGLHPTAGAEDRMAEIWYEALGPLLRPPSLAGPLHTLGPDVLPPAEQCLEYRTQLTSTGGSGNKIWTQTAGTFPDGLDLSESGEIEGTPAVAGHFNFTVQVRDATGATDQLELSLHVEAVNKGPTAQFTWTAIETGLSLDGSSTLATESPVVEYRWDLGDGNVSTNSDPVFQHFYAASGDYTVELTVTDEAGMTSSTSQVIRVTAAPPIAAFETLTTELHGAFDGSSSSDPVGMIVAWNWDFGDGATGAGEMVEHNFAENGDFDVALTVTDNRGFFHSVTQTIHIPGAVPFAAFDMTVNDLTLFVSANGSMDEHSDIVLYEWDFGDGNTATGSVAVHTWSMAGNYPVRLRVVDEVGLEGVLIQFADAIEPPPAKNLSDTRANLILSPDATITGNTLSRDPPLAIAWDPGRTNYVVTNTENAYGLAEGENRGVVTESNAIEWCCTWANPKCVNYVTFGGSITPSNAVGQTGTAWRVDVLNSNGWMELESGVGGWIDDGIYKWGGTGTDPLVIRGLKIRLYSSGTNHLVGTHLRGRGGKSLGMDDRATETKAALIQLVSLDADGDEIPDPWERAHGLSDTTNNATSDLDGDGCTDYEEWVAGTDPEDGSDYLHIVALSKEAEGMLLTFETTTDRMYDVEQLEAEEITHSTWQLLLENVPGNGQPLSLFDAEGENSRLYRLRPKLK